MEPAASTETSGSTPQSPLRSAGVRQPPPTWRAARAADADRCALQGSEPSHQQRAEQLHAVMSSTMEKVGAGGGLATPWAPPDCNPGSLASDSVPPQSVLGGQDQLRIRVAELEDEVRNLRKVNRDLFDFSTRIITRPAK